MENNKQSSVYESLKNTLSYISNSFLKAMSCTMKSKRTESTDPLPLPLPKEDLEGMKEPEPQPEPENKKDPTVVAPVKEEAVIIEEPIHIEDRI
jgi:hypothetical protein